MNDRVHETVSGVQARRGVFPLRHVTFLHRILALLIAAGVAVLFTVAGRLTPDERGFGTHEQLGLPPCSFRTLTGLGCPHCGLTTSFAWFVRGRWDASLRANPAGPPLAVVSALAGLGAVLVTVTGRRAGPEDPLRWMIPGALVFLAATIVIWLVRLSLEMV